MIVANTFIVEKSITNAQVIIAYQEETCVTWSMTVLGVWTKLNAQLENALANIDAINRQHVLASIAYVIRCQTAGMEMMNGFVLFQCVPWSANAYFKKIIFLYVSDNLCHYCFHWELCEWESQKWIALVSMIRLVSLRGVRFFNTWIWILINQSFRYCICGDKNTIVQI